MSIVRKKKKPTIIYIVSYWEQAQDPTDPTGRWYEEHTQKVFYKAEPALDCFLSVRRKNPQINKVELPPRKAISEPDDNIIRRVDVSENAPDVRYNPVPEPITASIPTEVVYPTNAPFTGRLISR